MRRYKRNRNIGLERALQHIEDAKQLSNELGGTDKDVKEYFFNLPKNKINKLFESYGEKYGNDVKEYAVETFPQWKSGKRQMSGLVAGRLYSMLPPMMPLETKYSMVKVLWDKYGPRTDKVLKAGAGVSAREIHLEASKYLIQTVKDWEVNSNLKKRFEWLSSGDVQIQEKLLNHFKNLEKLQIINGLKKKMPVLVNFINNNEKITGSLNETINIGNHQLRINFDLNNEGIKFINPEEDYSPHTYEDDTHENGNEKNKNWIFWGFLGLMFLLMLAGAD